MILPPNDLHVLYSFPTRLGVPGIGTTAWHQVNGLIQLGVRVTLFCGSCERPLPGLFRLVETMKMRGLKVPYRLFGNDRACRMHDRVVAKALFKLTGSVNVVHGWPLGSLRTLEAAKTLGVVSVLERPNAHTAFAYEVVAQEHEKLGLPIPKGYTHVFNASRLEREEAEYAAADLLACPSDFVASTFLDRGFEPSKIARHQYGYDPACYWPAKNGDRRSDDVFTAIFVGRCEPRKGLHYALQAWHESGAAKTGRFIICGSYIPGYREAIKKWLDHPSIEERGFTNDVPKEMRQADVLVLPSIEEGSALVTYEARACGLALVVSTATGAQCRHMHNSLVHDPADMNALRENFRVLVSDKALLDRLRSASVLGANDLTWVKAAERLQHIYEVALRPDRSTRTPMILVGRDLAC